MNNSVFGGIDEVFEGIKERLNLLPYLHRDVIEMSFGLDGGSPMNTKDIAFELKNEYIDLTPDVIELIQQEGLRMLRYVDRRKDWDHFPGPKDFDPSEFPHFSWRDVDRMIVSPDKIEEIRNYLTERYADSDYVTLPTLWDLYEYDGNAFGLSDEVKPSASDLLHLQQRMDLVADILEGMNKSLLPDRKYSKDNVSGVLEYSYLGIETAEKIVLLNTAYTHVLTPVRTLKGMFDETDENGVLILPGWFEPTEQDEADYDFKCKMDWDEKAPDDLIQDFSEFYLKLIELDNELSANTDPNTFDNELKGLFETLYLYEQCGNTYFEGDSPAIDMMIRRAIRFLKLKNIGAPLIAQWGEAAYLAQAYAIYKCGKSLDKIPKQAV